MKLDQLSKLELKCVNAWTKPLTLEALSRAIGRTSCTRDLYAIRDKLLNAHYIKKLKFKKCRHCGTQNKFEADVCINEECVKKFKKKVGRIGVYYQITNKLRSDYVTKSIGFTKAIFEDTLTKEEVKTLVLLLEKKVNNEELLNEKITKKMNNLNPNKKGRKRSFSLPYDNEPPLMKALNGIVEDLWLVLYEHVMVKRFRKLGYKIKAQYGKSLVVLAKKVLKECYCKFNRVDWVNRRMFSNLTQNKRLVDMEGAMTPSDSMLSSLITS